ncbi:MAG: ATPase, T2SS/T4P/T4SS family [Legionellaceae bacterium]|nr:ATPase, T2SS/T4P/T4SS family [Legionellaceae bacterium]
MDVLHGTAKLLVQRQLLTEADAFHHQRVAIELSLRLIPYLVAHTALSAKTIALTLAEHFNISYIDLDHYDELFHADYVIPESLLQKHCLLPLFCRNNQLHVAVDDPSDRVGLQALQFHTGLHVIPLVAETTQLTKRINTLLVTKEQQRLTQYFAEASASEQLSVSHLHEGDEAPVVQFVNRIINQAIEKGASDIHFEPYNNHYRIRYRQDGLLYEVATPDQQIAPRITARLKIMAHLDIAERRVPQDGRFSISVQSHTAVDCRVSTCPTVHGEKIVVRLLNTGFNIQPEIASLALMPRDKTCFLQALSKPQGLILVTGPTGSGKSMTLYAALNHLNTQEKNISTVEDPVEMTCFGINQVQVNPKIELTFANVLRSFLRQDPDVLMIGEIRDLETAEIAIKASQTGHLVLSTLHTNSAAETLMRLIHIGIPPFHVISSLQLIIAQRLIRKLCEQCKVVRTDLTSEQLFELGYSHAVATHHTFYKAQGCTHCTQGYRGRIALFEVMPMSMAINQLLMMPEQPISKIVEQAQQDGMLTIYQAGLAHVLAGITSFEEINRVS